MNFEEQQIKGKQQQDEHIVNCNYCNMSDTQFKERLFTVTNQDQRRQSFVKQWLEIDMTLLEFIRKYTCAIAHVYSFKMEFDFYKNYIDRTQLDYAWFFKLPKKKMKEDQIDESFSYVQTYIQHQLRITEERLRKAITKLINCIQNQENTISKSSMIDMMLLKAYTITFIRKDYQRLYYEFQQKIKLVLLQTEDIHLVKEFFDLKPSSIQITLARSIWNATIQEVEEKRKLLVDDNDISDSNQLPSTSMNSHNVSNPLQNLTFTALQMRRNTQPETIMTTINTIIDTIQKKKKLFLDLSEQQSYFPSINNSQWKIPLLMNIIENRQRTLKQCYQCDDDLLKQILLNNTQENISYIYIDDNPNMIYDDMETD